MYDESFLCRTLPNTYEAAGPQRVQQMQLKSVSSGTTAALLLQKEHTSLSLTRGGTPLEPLIHQHYYKKVITF